MFVILLFFLSKANKRICICNGDCKSFCVADIYFNSSSQLQIDKFIMQSVNMEEEIYFEFYSKQKDFTFSINTKKINDKKITMRVHERSKAIKLKIKLKSSFFYRMIDINPNYHIILPSLTPILSTNNQPKKKKVLNLPVQTSIPVSVDVKSMTHTSQVYCQSPNVTYWKSLDDDWKNYEFGCNIDDLTSENSSHCGLRCRTENGEFSYLFKGVKFAVYGTYSPDYGIFRVHIDGELTAEVDEKSDNYQEYSLLFESNILNYEWHNLRLEGLGHEFEISKIVYWPSLTAKRMNSTEFILNDIGWKNESDGVGSVRHYVNSGGLAAVKLKCTKFWFIGVTNDSYPDIEIYYNDISRVVSPRIGRNDNSYLIYESEEFHYKELTIRFIPQTYNKSNHLTIYTIYYEEPQIKIPIPISVGIMQMDKRGKSECYTHTNKMLSKFSYMVDFKCETNNLSIPNAYQCGMRCRGNNMEYNYTFTGVKFALYGCYDTKYGSFNVAYDNYSIQINTKGPFLRYSIFYESNLLSYREHKVIITPINNSMYEFYKIVYWPSMTAKRMNSTDFTKKVWHKYTDGIGGIREYTSSKGATATISHQCSKFWLYGAKHPEINNISIKYGKIERKIEQHWPTLIEGALLYESPELDTFNNTITLTLASGYILIYCIYFEEPPTPISVSLVRVKHDMTNTTCYQNMSTEIIPLTPDIDPSTIICDINDLNSMNAYQCGLVCSNSAGSFKYTFKGVKFAVYGTFDPNFGKMNVEIDGSNVSEINLYNKMRIPYLMLYESDAYNYAEHTVNLFAIEGKYELYKLVYWPSLKATRMNSTDFTKIGKWNYVSDGIGGAYEFQDGNSSASIMLETTKFWIYGVTDPSFGPINLNYNGVSVEINQKSDSRIEGALLYESPDLDNYSVSLSLTSESNALYLYCIYYEQINPPQITPVPISVTLDMMKPTGLNECGYYNNDTLFNYTKELPGKQDRGCDMDNIETPYAYQCGIKCWSSSATYEYKFTGVKFAIYGTKSLKYHKFDVSFDGVIITTIDENIQTGDNILEMLYESDTYVYMEHTIKILPRNQTYELYKIVYWPSLNAKRINSTDFVKTYGTWIKQSDGIGGFWEITNTKWGRMYKTMSCSRIWLYCNFKSEHGSVYITYNDIKYNRLQGIQNERDGALFYDSKEFAHYFINLTWEVMYGTTSFYMAYYHDDPSITEYIDKKFNKTLPYIEILISKNSIIKQISGCIFYDISEDLDYFITIEKDFLLLDNVFQYNEPFGEKPAPINAYYSCRVFMKNCSFEKSISRNKGGNVFDSPKYTPINAVFESCNFKDCGNDKSKMIINIEDARSHILFSHCNFSFSEGQTPSKIINTTCINFIINACNFIKTGAIIIKIPDIRVDYTINDLISINESKFDSCTCEEKNYASCLHIEIDKTFFKFENNTICNTNVPNNYEGTIIVDFKNTVDEVELKHINFINNIAYSLYGGGSGILIRRASHLSFIDCNFTLNQARQITSPTRSNGTYGLVGDYYNGDGGGIQIGFECRTNGAAIKFEDCKFIGNKAQRHGGALALQTLNTVEIINCIFIQNEANYQFSDASELLFENHFHKKSEGRGGAIYINPSYNYYFYNNTRCFDENAHMTNVTIDNCTFTKNSAHDGYAIYVEGDDLGTVFDIENNDFIDNNNIIDINNTNKSDIATEIHSILKDVVESNNFVHSNNSHEKLIYVNHKGEFFSDSQKFTKSDVFSQTNRFSKTSEFSKTHEFSYSSKFTKTNYFSPSEFFSNSNKFSMSNFFIETLFFSNSNKFSISNVFSETLFFSYSKNLIDLSNSNSSPIDEMSTTIDDESTSNSLYSEEKYDQESSNLDIYSTSSFDDEITNTNELPTNYESYLSESNIESDLTSEFDKETTSNHETDLSFSYFFDESLNSKYETTINFEDDSTNSNNFFDQSSLSNDKSTSFEYETSIDKTTDLNENITKTSKSEEEITSQYEQISSPTFSSNSDILQDDFTSILIQESQSSIKFTKSSAFTLSDTFSDNTIDFHSNKITFSMSYSLTYVRKRSVSFSLSYSLSNIYEMSYDANDGTYIMVISQTNNLAYFPYIIYYYSPLYVETSVIFNFVKKSKITAEQLIGIVCGSVSVFFFVIGTVILFLKRKHDIKHQFDDFSISSDEDKAIIVNNEKIESKMIDNNEAQNQTIDSDSYDFYEFWA